MLCPCPCNPLFIVLGRAAGLYSSRITSQANYNDDNEKTYSEKMALPKYTNKFNRTWNFCKDLGAQALMMYTIFHCQRQYLFVLYIAYLLSDIYLMDYVKDDDIDTRKRHAGIAIPVNDSLSSKLLNLGNSVSDFILKATFLKESDCCTTKFTWSLRMVIKALLFGLVTTAAVTGYYYYLTVKMPTEFMLGLFFTAGSLMYVAARYLATLANPLCHETFKQDPNTIADYQVFADKFMKYEREMLATNTACTLLFYLTGTLIFGTSPSHLVSALAALANGITQALLSYNTYTKQSELMENFGKAPDEEVQSETPDGSCCSSKLANQH